jgi:hypothetical protein
MSYDKLISLAVGGLVKLARVSFSDDQETKKAKEFAKVAKKLENANVTSGLAQARSSVDLADLIYKQPAGTLTAVDDIVRNVAKSVSEMMSKGYRTKYFSIEELVDPVTLSKLGSRAWGMLDPGLLFDLDTIRSKIGRITVNDWAMDGDFQFSGFRPASTNVGAVHSLHRLGKAIDIKPLDVSVEEAAKEIEALASKGGLTSITRMENPAITKSWLHLDTGFEPKQEDAIYVFNP